jgi:hypothetical protein
MAQSAECVTLRGLATPHRWRRHLTEGRANGHFRVHQSVSIAGDLGRMVVEGNLSFR